MTDNLPCMPSPCSHCPLRNDITPWWRLIDAIDRAEDASQGKAQLCHKTAIDTGIGGSVDRPGQKLHLCAGSILFARKIGRECHPEYNPVGEELVWGSLRELLICSVTDWSVLLSYPLGIDMGPGGKEIKSSATTTP